MSIKFNYWLVAILSAALLLRIVYWSEVLLGRDAIGYAIGGLGTWSAHSPGYFGYCFIGWLVNQVVANINDSLILINVVTSLLGIFFCHRLAESFGLSGRNALLATAAYAFSINLDYLSVVALSHAPEGMFATLFALVCRKAIKSQSFRLTLLATCIWAVSGAFRQTSIAFLTPLWIYTLWASGPLKRMPLYVLVAVPLVLLWSRPNSYYQAAYGGNVNADTGDNFWRLQVMMPSSYDQASLGMEEDAKSHAVSNYHWPFIEVLYWMDETVGTHLLPDYRLYGAPAPSLEHATKLAGLQLGKLGFYMAFSLPCVVLLMALIPRVRRISGLFRTGELPFLFAWMFPVGTFFVVGHLGHFGYLQIFLSGFSVLTVLLLSRAWEAERQPSWPRWQIAHVGATLAGLAFFLLARPYQSSDRREKLLDVIALQYTGRGIQEHYTASRWSVNQPGPALTEDWFEFKTDEEIVKWFSMGVMASKCIYKPRVVR